ncbi:ATP-binding protein [Pontibacter silvestris]|uniref:histidine kinase n=1 Tax=Pontibacter silvestris TaxID=2305183 RepID=A0ABW4WTX8_9BACT|nr:HAMP domain-containing sensor histidine kinase [Pontibacter silvestris]MCC9137837.1 HAMP domain-containing histidine kinase [Pontibacter silvestris]
MIIRKKLTIQFTSIFAILLLVFSLGVYYFTSLYRQSDFYERIRLRAYAAAHHVLDANELSDSTQHQNMIKYYHSLPYEAVRIYRSNGDRYFSDGDGELSIDQKLLEKVKRQKVVRYDVGVRQIVAVFYPDDEGDFIVLSSCIDVYSLRKLQHLKVLLIISFLVSMGIVIVAGWAFAKQAMRPIKKIVSEVEKINASGLNMRLSNADGKDEISHLAQIFNKMLDRLELAFEMQSTFVSNASHELRTPLTAMIGELEVALMKPRETKEYQRVLQSTLEDARLLAELSNGLLQIAQASLDSSKITQSYLRFDELVWMAREQALKRQPNARIDIDFANFPDDEDRLIIKGNEALLLIAVVNVLENAIKFSPQTRAITGFITVEKLDVSLKVKDQGVGIAQEDLKHVFVPFFRADNVRNITGHGIGLPLAERILKLHRGSIQIDSRINKGTEVTIKLPQAYMFIPNRV